jgi:hypothetical protein
MTKMLFGIPTTFLALMLVLSSDTHAGFAGRLKVPTALSVLQKACDCYDEDDDEDDEDNEDNIYAFGKRATASVNRRPKHPSAKVTRSVEGTKTIGNADVQSEPCCERANVIVETENSAIATAHDHVAAAQHVGCKNYFASAGMTLSVLCGN